MHIIMLGIGIGFLTLVPPGPVSLTLLQVGARLGVQPAMRGALGVASGDLVLGWVAVTIVGAGTTLPPAIFQLGQQLAAAVLLVLGAILFRRPDAATSSVQRITRPGRTLFLLTSLTPSALGAWIALLAAMPFAGDPTQLGLFAAGVVLASFLWHPVLAALAARLGSRLSEAGHAQLTQAGGATMVMLGGVLVAQQLL